MTQSNTSNQDSSQDWTFKTEEELAHEKLVETSMLTFSDSNSHAIVSLTPNLRLQFYREGKECGSFDWSTGKMTFEGDADASAKAFLEGVRFYIDSYIASKVNNVKFELDTFFEHFK